METTSGFLPVISTIKSATSRLWDARRALFWLLVLAGVANGALDWAAFSLSENNTSRSYLANALKVLVYTVLAVRVHRLVLGAENSVGGNVRWTGRETRFLGWLVVVYFYLILVFVALALLIGAFVGAFGAIAPVPREGWMGWMSIFVFLASLPAAYLFVRLSVLLPATAVDQRRTIAWAWGLTEANGWRLVLLLWVVPMLLSILVPNFEVASLLGWITLNLVWGMLTALEIAILSVAFQALGGLHEEQEALAVT